MPTKIEWAEETWNPVTGCTKVSPGCAHCYAERMHNRLATTWGVPPFSQVTIHPARLGIPVHWRKPRRIFVCSMSDLFHEAVPAGFIETVLATAKDCPQHTFLFLTKRPARMLDFNFPPNAWAGVTVESEDTIRRAYALAFVSAPVRFVSCEPLLGPISFAYHNLLPDLHWVIAGAESGPGARPMDEGWARRIRDDCVDAGVPFFLKQARGPDGKMIKMPALDSCQWAQFPGQNNSNGGAEDG